MADVFKRVIVKFRDSVSLPYADDNGDAIQEQGLGSWTELEADFPGIRIRRLYPDIPPSRLTELVARAKAGNPDYVAPNFFTYFFVEFPFANDASDVAAKLRAFPMVERAYPEREAHTATGVDATAYALNVLQGYEDAAPLGIDARCAWTARGGDGEGQSIIDVELGWTLDHDDYVVHGPQLLGGEIVDADRSHGTSVLGIICAADNPSGIVGITPNIAGVDVVSVKRPEDVEIKSVYLSQAIAIAATYLEAGNVLLIEMDSGFLPCETDYACYQQILTATSAGISVVEAAGNGNVNLDTWTDDAGNPILFRDSASPSYQESGAIIVASATSTVPHVRRANSNYGARIDCYAWGDSVETSDSADATDLSSHTVAPFFLNTSAAAAIVAGAALSVQGMAEFTRGQRLTPSQLRAVLTTGTPSRDAIGVMPDLCAIAASIGVTTSSP